MSEYDSKADTLEHIQHVRNAIGWAIQELAHKAQIHDQTKLGPEEKEIYDEFTPKLKGMTYGSDEYNDCLKNMGPAIKHHWANHRHHPEFMIQDETWKKVPDFDGYEISSYGNIRSIDRLIKRGDAYHNQKGTTLSQNVVPKGYCRVQLSDDGKKKNFFIHTLVALVFIGQPSDDTLEVNHKDGNKKNNHYLNLEWVSRSDNLQHAYDNGLRDPTFKCVVTCEELNITTIGTVEMAEKLKELGYIQVKPSGIWKCINYGGQHSGLTFTGALFEKWMNSPVARMNVIDLLEMVLDWYSATKRHDDGDIHKSVEISQKRFGYSDDMKSILHNTADWLLAREKGINY